MPAALKEPRLYLRGRVWWAGYNSRRWSLRTEDETVARKIAAIEMDGLVTSELATTIIRQLRADPVLRRAVLRAFATDKAEGSIYFLLEMGSGLVKIGFTTDVEQRVEHIQVHCASETKLLKTMNGTRADEKALHARFKALRVRGEWFRHEGPLAAFLASN